MDTYGHLFPGQEADAVASLDQFFPNTPEGQSATGTDGYAQHEAQQLGRDTVQYDATPCNNQNPSRAVKAECGEDANILPLTTLSAGGRLDANQCDARIPPSAPIAQLAEQLTLNQ